MKTKADLDRKILFAALVVFWSGLTVIASFKATIDTGAFPFVQTARRAVEAVFGSVLCLIMVWVLHWFDFRSAFHRWLLLTGLSLALGLVLSVAHDWAQLLVAPREIVTCWYATGCSTPIRIGSAFDDAVSHGFMLLAWGMLYLALLAVAQNKSAERTAATARDDANTALEEARLAELRALRYQIDPHFLFNSLNSLATLVDRDEKQAARHMISDMAGFLRYGLEIDPLADVELDDEIEMQRRYLEIERNRFAHRLTVEIEIDPQARRALIPSLLLQPLVENAVKHGVATTSAPVSVQIRATTGPRSTVRVMVDDDAPLLKGALTGQFGVGLRNVSERLRVRFGSHASLVVGPRPGGGYRAEIEMPKVLP